MHFNQHFGLEGQHAFLGPSNYHWINYDIAKLDERYLTYKAATLGTELHDYARRSIELGIKLPRSNRTLNMYVNDAIGYRMAPEQILFYSDNCFGTADTISFRRGLLRIHDLKTGKIPASMHQLEVYAALFCLEYAKRPGEISMELRIYQNDDILVEVPEVDIISHIIDKIITLNKRIEQLKVEEEK